MFMPLCYNCKINVKYNRLIVKFLFTFCIIFFTSKRGDGVKIKRIISLVLCFSIFLCLIPVLQAFADVTNVPEATADEHSVWLSSDFSTMDDNWILSNGMYHDAYDEVIRVEEATGTGSDIAEANYSLSGLDFGNRWNIRFRMKLEEGHQGRVDFHFCYGGYRTYCVVTPEENKFSLQGNGSRTDRETLTGVWYEYLFQYYIENGITKLKIWRKAEGADSWLDIFTGYPFSETNLYTGPPALRFFGGIQGGNKKIAIDDVRVYSGTYAVLNEPYVQGTNVKIDGVIDTSDYGITSQREVTLLAASYDKKFGYTKEVHSTTIDVEPGYETAINHTFRFSSLNHKTDAVKTMMWDNIESGIPLSSASGFEQENSSNDIPETGQEVGITPSVFYNEVSLNGYLGNGKCKFTASLIKNDTIYAITQGNANENGVVSAKLAVDPSCESGIYTLRLQYGNMPAKETLVTLQCSDSMHESYDSMEEIIGQNNVPHKSFDFTAKNASSLYTGNGYHSSGRRYFNRVTGMFLNSTLTTTYWRYAPNANWFVLGDRRAVTFRAKMYDESSPLDLLIFEPNKNFTAHEFVITASGISTGCSYKTLNSEFSPGTGWVDYLVVKTSTGIKLYASKEGVLSGKWVLVLETTGTNSSYASTIGGIHFIGTGFISRLDIYNTNTTVADSVETVLGNQVSSKISLQMNESFRKSDNLIHSETCEYGKDGLSISAGDLRFVLTEHWRAIEKNNAVYIRTKVNDVSNVMNIRLSGENGTAKMQLSSTGLIAYNGVGTAKKLASFSGTEWTEYLIYTNSLGGYSIYATQDQLTEWYKVAETEDFPEPVSDDLGIEITGTGVIQFIKQLDKTQVVSEFDSKPYNANTAYYQEEFLNIPREQSNVSVSSGSVQDGNLILNATEKEEGYSVKNGAIPLGGYVEFRIKTDGKTEFFTADGSKGICIAMESGRYTLKATTNKNLAVFDGGNEFKTWRVVRNNNGTYSGYCKVDGDKGWYPAFLNINGYATTSEPETAISVYDGTSIFDYLIIYGPEHQNSLILTDGYGTKVLEKDSTYQCHDCIRALVKLNEFQPQTLLFVEYVQGALSHWEMREVPAGSGSISIPYSVSNTAADIKVFLWDSLSGMSAAGNAQKANHSWSLSGKAKDLNGGFSMNLDTATDSIVTYDEEIGENFDVEWTMKINFFSGFECANIYTGKHKIGLTFNRDGISYFTKNGSENVAFELDSNTHSYRLIGKQGICYLYLDGAFVATLKDFPENYEKSRIEFRSGS